MWWLLHNLSTIVRNNDSVLSESLVQQRQFERNSHTDVLTGLYNRQWLNQMLPRIVERSRSGQPPLGLMLLDLDHFKRFNDSYGHLAGDEALRMVGAELRANIRPNDAAVRYGGEEFVIILPGLEQQEVVEMAERLRVTLSRHQLQDRNGAPLPGITVSIGVARLQPNQEGEDLIAAADHALYRAKEAGRDRVVSD